MKYFRRITKERHHQSSPVTQANGNSCATISGIHSLARSTQETMNGGFKCISWAFGTRYHRLGGYGTPSISLSQPITQASSTSATLSQSTNVVRSFVKICFGRHSARMFSSLVSWWAFRHWWGRATRRRSTVVEFVQMDARASSECWPIFRCGEIKRARCREACTSLG